MLSQTVEYALRAVVFLAEDPSSPRTTAQIARRTCVPRAYLSKVLQSLRRARIVALQRGVGGGVMLASPPSAITILDVVTAVEPIGRIHRCPLGLAAHGARLCPLHQRLDRALATVERAFADTTLAEILAEPSRSPPLCELPVAAPRGKRTAKKKRRSTKRHSSARPSR